MAKKFLITDLDGTLLDTPKRLSKAYVDQLNAWIEQGLALTIATGRDLKKTIKALNGLKIKYPVILTNGAILADLSTEKYLKITSIDAMISKHIVKSGEEMGLFPIVYAAYDSGKQEMHFNKGKWGPNKQITNLHRDKVIPFQSFQCVSIQYHAEKEKLLPLLTTIQDCYGVHVNIIFIEDVAYNASGVAGEWYWLEINSHEAGKEKMLQYLVSELNISIDDVIAFGDNHNDLEMVTLAGQGIAVANAVDEVKNKADLVISSNSTGGVIQYIKERLKQFI